MVRRENGSPVNPGTIVRFTTTLGTITETSATDAQGVARATLTSDGRIGTAKVVASSGPVKTDAIDVQIGLQAGTVSLSATPSTVKETGGQIKLIALLRDASGQPLAGALTNFQTQIGTLASGGAFVSSSSGGQAQDTLNLSSADVSTLSGDTFTVKVSVSGASGLVTDTSTIGIQRLPRASFTVLPDPASRSAVFTDTSTGKPTNWAWDFGDGATSAQQNPAHIYGAKGTYIITLTVSNAQGSSSASRALNFTQ